MTDEQQQHSDFEWFVRHYQKLHRKYGTCYMAIKNKKVLGCYSSHVDAINKTAEVEKLGTFIVQHCTGDKDGYTTYIY